MIPYKIYLSSCSFTILIKHDARSDGWLSEEAAFNKLENYAAYE
jgi:hypothetical protein